MPPFRKNLNFYTALALFIAASLGAVVSYAGISERSRSNFLFSEGLSPGRHSFAVYAGDRCVGEIEVSLLKEDEKMVFKADGQLRIIYRGESHTIAVNSYAQFNSLMQLGAQVTQLSSGGTRLVVGAENVNPIRMTLRLQQGEKAPLLDQKIEMPGPIVLHELRRGKFTLEYSRLHGMQMQQFTRFADLLKDYGLRAAVESNGDTCGSEAAVDVTAGFDALQHTALRLKPLLDARFFTPK